MGFIQFKPYGVNQTPPFIDTNRVVSFSLIDYNGNYGTEIVMESGSIRVGEWPDEVARKLNAALKPEPNVCVNCHHFFEADRTYCPFCDTKAGE